MRALLAEVIADPAANTRAKLVDGLSRIVEGIAAAHDAKATVEILPGYPVVVNDASLGTDGGENGVMRT